MRADMEHDIETKQQQVSSLTASLALAQQEVRYLQDIADGGSSKSAFAQVKSFMFLRVPCAICSVEC